MRLKQGTKSKMPDKIKISENMTPNQKQSAALKTCSEISTVSNNYSVIILQNVETGQVLANTTVFTAEHLAELMASFASTYAKNENVTQNEMLGMFSRYFAKFAKIAEKDLDTDKKFY